MRNPDTSGGALPSNKTENSKVILAGLFGRALPRAVSEDHLDELERLVDTAGGQVIARVLQERDTPDPATYLGRGKVREVAEQAGALSAGWIVVDDELTPSQVRNLEKELPARVLDRPAVILQIFAARARSREAMTQVELARLQYLLPRLSSSAANLAQQRGGGAFRAGGGEKQIELDRRKIRRRIATLKEELERIEKSRGVQKRRLHRMAVIALAGYTNAGKTTLFNRLTSSREFAEDRLFATLDPRHARLLGVEGRPVVVSDTVGFLRKLPHSLVASFRSTLREVEEADLVVHVVDASSPQAEEQRQVAEEVLAGLGVDPERILLGYNKVDALTAKGENPEALSFSAKTGEGMAELKAAIVKRLESLGVPIPVPNYATEVRS
ncbi:MAG: GTPase HflX [Acidobacteria bacterium]|nr:GTPase HflX [Acidobacteriota bacterium]